MDAALVALVGVSGTLAGILVKAVFDRFAEQSRRDREDVVWRRQHALAAAAEFLSAADLLHVEERTVRQLSDAMVMDREAGHMDAFTQHGVQLDAEQAKRRVLLERTNEALSKVGLLVEQETWRAAIGYLEDISDRPDDMTLPFRKTALLDLFRADLGLPPREIDPESALTFDEALQRIEEGRRASGDEQDQTTMP